MRKQTQKQRYVLYLPSGPNARSFLTVMFSDGRKVELDLPPRFTRLLVVLYTFLMKDLGSGRDASVCGWRCRGDVACAVAVITRYTVERTTVSRYASDLKRRLNREAKAAGLPTGLSLIECRRNLGMRLDRGALLEVEDGHAEDASEVPEAGELMLVG